jgi:hypothetical protein
MLSDLIGQAATYGLEVHTGKTKILSNVEERRGDEARASATIAGKDVEILPYSGKAKYLGRHVSFSHPMDTTEIENRIITAWKKFWALKNVFCDRGYPLKSRLRLFDAVITPTALYGSGSWTLTEMHLARLKKTQRRMLRSILQHGRRRQQPMSETSSIQTASEIQDEDLEPWLEWIQRVTREVEQVQAKLKIDDWTTACQRRKYKWAGHASRRTDGRWSTAMLDWQPEGGPRQSGQGRGRRHARPNRRWCDTIDQYFISIGMQAGEWRIMAANRNEWHQHEAQFLTYVSR